MADPEILQPERIAPRRNPSLIQRIAARVIRFDPATGPQQAEQQSTQTGISDPNADYADQFFSFNYDVDRKAIYRDVDEMDSSSDEVATALDVIAANASTSEDGQQTTFEVLAQEQSVQQDIDEILASSGLQSKARVILRNLAKYGDVFIEPEFNAELDIVDARALPPASVWRNEDDYGNLKVAPPKMDKEGRVANRRGECAFEQIDPDTQNLVATFYPWQVIHGRLNWDGFRKYGRSLLRVARLTWRKLKALEEALIIGRMTRDLMKLVFYIDTTGLAPKQKKQVLREFKESVSMRHRPDVKRENPFSVLTDFYLSDGYVRVGGQPMPMRTRVEAIDPKNTGQHQLDDIKFFHRKLLMDLRVPAAHLSWEQEAQAGILTQQDVQYVRWLRTLQQEAGNVIDEVISLGLIMRGVDPRKVEWAIVWPALRATDEAAAAQTYLAYAQGDQLYMQEGVLAPSWIQKHRFNMDDDEIAENQAELEDLQQQEMEQAQQLADQQHQNEMELTKAKTSTQGNGPRDRDGQRKGDEGRDSNGNRIAPTKSKRNVNNPTGTGRRRVTQDAPVITYHRRGSLSKTHRILLESMAANSEAQKAIKLRRRDILLAREAIVQDTGSADIVPPSTVTSYKSGGKIVSKATSFSKTADEDHTKKKRKKDLVDIVEYRPVSPLLQERQAEVGKRDPQHVHGYMDPEKVVLTFDLHGTLTPCLGYPLDEAPFDDLTDWLWRMKGRGCCLHIATGSLDHYDPEIARVREQMIRDWLYKFNVPIDFVGPKVRAAVFVDDRGVEIPLKPDWKAIGASAEERLLKAWELKDGVYVKREGLKPKGKEITQWPDIESVPPDFPRGFTSPIVDVDVHRTLMPAWGGGRIADPDPKGVAALRRLYGKGYQIHLSTSSINTATHSDQSAAERLASMRKWAYDHNIPYDRFVSHDDCELFFDDLALRFADWDTALPEIERRLRRLTEMPRPA